jgi:hypothetical protein
MDPTTGLMISVSVLGASAIVAAIVYKSSLSPKATPPNMQVLMNIYADSKGKSLEEWTQIYGKYFDTSRPKSGRTWIHDKSPAPAINHEVWSSVEDASARLLPQPRDALYLFHDARGLIQRLGYAMQGSPKFYAIIPS